MKLPRYVVDKTVDTYSIWDTTNHEWVYEDGKLLSFDSKLEASEKCKQLNNVNL